MEGQMNVGWRVLCGVRDVEDNIIFCTGEEMSIRTLQVVLLNRLAIRLTNFAAQSEKSFFFMQ